MSKVNLKAKSITQKLILPIIIILIIQAIVLESIVLSNKTEEIFNNNAFNMLNNTVESRNNYIEQKMMKEWTNIEESKESINTKIQDILKNKTFTINDLKDNAELKTEILKEISNDLFLILEKNGVKGSFFIFNTSQEEQDVNYNKIQESGLYIRKTDDINSININSISNTFLEIGPKKVSESLGISLSDNWNDKITFDLNNTKDNYNFFIKPIKAAKEYRNKSDKDLAYWSPTFKLNNEGEEIITYSMPIRDDEKNTYGVIGIEINSNYINKMLPYEEINPHKKGNYFVGINKDNNDMNFNIIALSGSKHKNLIDSAKNIIFEEKQIYNNFHAVKFNNTNKNIVYGCVKYLNLYNSNSPFSNEKWTTTALIEKDVVLHSYEFARNLFTLILLIVTFIGILFVYLLGNRVLKPIKSLVKNLGEKDIKGKVVFEKTNIEEIDELFLAVEELITKVADSSSKLSQIIQLFNMPIGAFEYKNGDNIVFCTEQFFNILGVKNIKKEFSYVEKTFFEEIMYELTNSKDLSYDGIYNIEKGNGVNIWIRLKTFKDSSKILGVISDITQDILEKRKIEYERDYDVLTNILNRRAFYKIVNKKFMQDEVEIGAFIMWDLDNLKYINDTYGHDYGDKYIKKAASILKEFANHNVIVGRMSGDEFYTFIYGYENKEQIRDIIKNIHKAMKSNNIKLPNESKLKIRASGGIAWYPDDSIKYEELAKYSDFAMYNIKNKAKGNLNEFDINEYKRDSFLLNSKEELNKLIDGNYIKYVFQPIISATTGKTYGYEALMRSNLESLNNPIDILRIATAQFKLYQIERITWFKAMEAFVSNKEEFGDAKLFINSIPNCILSDEDIKKFQSMYGVYGNRIVLELLENERSNKDYILKKKDIIKEWKGSIAIDDFGAGYNNESLLLDITPDIVKIDMKLIKSIDSDLNRQQILKNIISYCKEREIKILAEGIETKRELETLISLGVDYLQGYYLSRPQCTPPKINEDIIQEILDINSNKNVNGNVDCVII